MRLQLVYAALAATLILPAGAQAQTHDDLGDLFPEKRRACREGLSDAERSAQREAPGLEREEMSDSERQALRDQRHAEARQRRESMLPGQRAAARAAMREKHKTHRAKSCPYRNSKSEEERAQARDRLDERRSHEEHFSPRGD